MLLQNRVDVFGNLFRTSARHDDRHPWQRNLQRRPVIEAGMLTTRMILNLLSRGLDGG
jgi:hypothetical protein